ncbi:TBC1 domain family member 15 [Thelohanellus kitauei]|uniref:TBC1 domain family member 15 n=1 Tax=Thelohanellus kitauei TaxID=669202 RepID=A0A0C2N843_THEKT|nr:TBC1 domain family member 15 [Thelohanellus kitauei]
MDFTNLQILLHQRNVYLRVKNNDFLICGDLQVVQKGHFIFLCWSISDQEKPIFRTTISRDSGKITTELFDIKTCIDQKTTPFCTKKNTLIDYSELYITKHGVCIIPQSETRKLRYHRGQNPSKPPEELEIGELLQKTSYFDFSPPDIKFCYLSCSQEADTLFKVLNGSFWLKKCPNDQDLYIITNSDDYTKLSAKNKPDYVSLIGQALFASTNNIFELVRSISEPAIASSAIFDKYIYQDPYDEELIAEVSGQYVPMIRESQVWETRFDSDGRLISLQKLIDDVFSSGVSNAHRLVAYKYILGYYRESMNSIERDEHDAAKKLEYQAIKQKMEASVNDPKFKNLNMHFDMISKDVPRCDRFYSFYKGDDNPNLECLEEILRIYSFYNYKMGYDQSMTDFLSPLLYLVKNKVDTFWLFVHMMEKRNKLLNQCENHIYDVLCSLTMLTSFFFPQFYLYVYKIYKISANDLFYLGSFFGRLKLDFKRDFTLDEVTRVWEVIWTQKLVKNYNLFICLCYISKLYNSFDYKQHEFIELTKKFPKFTLGNCENIIQETNKIIESIKKEKKLPQFIKNYL